DLSETLLFVGRKGSTITNKALVSVFKQFSFCLSQIQRIFLFVNSLNTLEQLSIQYDIIRVSRKLWSYFHSYCLKLIGSITLIKIEEHRSNLLQQFAAEIHCNNSIFKRWSLSIVDDSFNLLILLLHTFFESRHVVLILNQIKRRYTLRSLPGCQEGISFLLFSTCVKRHDTNS